MKVEQMNFVTHLIITALPDADLEIRWGGGGRSSRPLDKGGGLQKTFFCPSGLRLV